MWFFLAPYDKSTLSLALHLEDSIFFLQGHTTSVGWKYPNPKFVSSSCIKSVPCNFIIEYFLRNVWNIWYSVVVVFTETFQKMFKGKRVKFTRGMRIHRMATSGVTFLSHPSVQTRNWRNNRQFILIEGCTHSDTFIERVFAAREQPCHFLACTHGSCVLDHGRHGGITDTKITSTRHACKSQQILSLSLFPRAHGSCIFAQKL